MSPARRAAPIVAGFLGLHVVLAALPARNLWGLDLLAYAPPWAAILLGAGGSLLLLPAGRRTLLSGLGRGAKTMDRLPAGWRTPAVLLLLAGVSLALFVIFRSAVHLLGDGALYVRELNEGVWEHGSRTDRAPLTFFLIRRLHHLTASLAADGALTYRVISYASGLLYMVLALFTARSLSDSRTGRAVLVSLLATGGFVQMFCGYVENYALHLALLLAYLLAGIRDLEARRVPWRAALVLAVLLPLHFVFAALLPSQAALVFLASRRERPHRSLRAWAEALGLTAAATAGGGLLLAAIGFHPLVYFHGEAGSHFLPLLAPPGFRQHYRLLSWGHALDLGNLLVLVAPGALLAGLVLGGKALRLDRTTAFPAAAALGLGCFVFLANPEIGMFRDWDVLSLGAVPLLLVAGRLLTRHAEPRTLAHTGLLVAGAALLHTAAWVGVNADAARAVRRFRTVLEHAPLSRHARSYGWESLGSYDEGAGQTDAAAEDFTRAIAAAPRNPRHRLSLGTILLKGGDPAGALREFREALGLDPDRSETYNRIGLARYALGDVAGALKSFDRAAELDPNNADAFLNWGNVNMERRRIREAERAYRRALEVDPGSAEAHANLAAALYAEGRFDEAIALAAFAVDRRPRLWDAYYTLGACYWQKNDRGRGRRYFERFLAGDPGNANAPAVRKLLGSP